MLTISGNNNQTLNGVEGKFHFHFTNNLGNTIPEYEYPTLANKALNEIYSLNEKGLTEGNLFTSILDSDTGIRAEFIGYWKLKD